MTGLLPKGSRSSAGENTSSVQRSAFSDGRYRLRWRGKVHEGQTASQAQAVRFMGKWIKARGMDAPFVDVKTKRSLVVPLGDFLRDYENGKT